MERVIEKELKSPFRSLFCFSRPQRYRHNTEEGISDLYTRGCKMESIKEKERSSMWLCLSGP
jgi:hypothetical protein